MKTICASWAFLHSFINSGIISKYMSPNTLHMSILSVFLAFTWRPHSMWNIYSCAAASNKCYYTLESPFFFFLLFILVCRCRFQLSTTCSPKALKHGGMAEQKNWTNSLRDKRKQQTIFAPVRSWTTKKTNNKRTLFISFFYLCVCSIFLFFPVIFLNAFFLQFTVDQRLLAFVAGDSHTAPHRSTFFRPRCITALGGTWHIP